MSTIYPLFTPAAVDNYSPLVVLHNFSQSDESHVKLMRTTFQHMFPSISVKTVKLPECRRVVLFHYHPEDGTVEMRHYAVRATPTGINKSIKKLLEAKIPDLGRLDDVSEFVDGTELNSIASDSEGEDDNSKVSLPDRFVGRGNAQSQQASIVSSITHIQFIITFKISTCPY